MSQQESGCTKSESPAFGDRKPARWQVAAVCAFLALAVGIVFGQTLRFEFINFDDPDNVYRNPHVARGLSMETVKWAFTQRHACSWMPMTWISHMVTCQVFGLSAGGHHLGNVLLHGATSILLFVLLCKMTGQLWPSALVAAVFAIHPLRVESVAWVTERKDVLSGLFFMLALAAYGSYSRRPFSFLRYAAVLLCFAMGLMSKPMLVTLPFVLLLLDYWPLRRWTTTTAARLVLEKVPFLAMIPVSCAMTVWAFGDVLGTLQQGSALSWRMENAIVSYVAYLGMFFYPANLALSYPRPAAIFPLWRVCGAVVILAAITLGAWATRRKRPYLLVGWLWYAGMLVPVSGVLQYAPVTLADRFTYLPQIGLCIAVTWGLAETLKSRPSLRPMGGLVAAFLLAVLMACAWRQTSFWRDSIALWNRTLACTSQNWSVHDSLGNALFDAGRTEEAIQQFQAAIAIEPNCAAAHYNLGVALARAGRLYGAIDHYRAAIVIDPGDARLPYNLAIALERLGRTDEAIAQYEQAVHLQPDNAVAHNNLGHALFVQGKDEAAMFHYRESLQIDPQCAEAHYNLGNLLIRRGLAGEAIAEYCRALEAQPAFAAQVHNALGLALIADGRADEAVAQYQKALALRPDFAEAQINLNRVLVGKPRSKEPKP